MKNKMVLIIAVWAAIPTLVLAQGMTSMGNSPADKANMEAMQKMQSAMPKQGSGDADKDFVMMMMPHHQGAIDMARVELQYGSDPMLKKMAEDIVKAQQKEITELKAWETKHK